MAGANSEGSLAGAPVSEEIPSEQAPPELIKAAEEAATAKRAKGIRGYWARKKVKRSSVDLSTDAAIARDRQRMSNKLFNGYGWVLLVILIGQLIIGDLLFFLFEWRGVHWHLDDTAISAWLGSTIVQVSGIVIIVTKHLFPNQDGK